MAIIQVVRPFGKLLTYTTCELKHIGKQNPALTDDTYQGIVHYEKHRQERCERLFDMSKVPPPHERHVAQVKTTAEKMAGGDKPMADKTTSNAGGKVDDEVVWKLEDTRNGASQHDSGMKLSDEQFPEFLKNNPNIKSLLTRNLRSQVDKQVEKQTEKLRSAIAEKDAEIARLTKQLEKVHEAPSREQLVKQEDFDHMKSDINILFDDRDSLLKLFESLKTQVAALETGQMESARLIGLTEERVYTLEADILPSKRKQLEGLMAEQLLAKSSSIPISNNNCGRATMPLDLQKPTPSWGLGSFNSTLSPLQAPTSVQMKYPSIAGPEERAMGTQSGEEMTPRELKESIQEQETTRARAKKKAKPVVVLKSKAEQSEMSNTEAKKKLASTTISPPKPDTPSPLVKNYTTNSQTTDRLPTKAEVPLTSQPPPFSTNVAPRSLPPHLRSKKPNLTDSIHATPPVPAPTDLKDFTPGKPWGVS